MSPSHQNDLSHDIAPAGGREKPDTIHAEEGAIGDRQLHGHGEATAHGDNALKVIGEERIVVTEEDDDRLRRKTDKHILSILVWIYFLQILDKSVLGYGNVFGLSTDTGLVGRDYSLMASMNAIAQLAWQPFSAYLIVRVPSRILMTVLVFGWGTAQACMAAPHNFGGLVATRFLLGLFEAGCLPLFSILTAQWYRRSEQPLRVAAWYGTNGIATIFASILSFGLGHISSDHIKSWQVIFIFVGLLTVISAPIVYLVLDSDVAHARFFTPHERLMAIERLRANQTGMGSNEFKWAQVWEMVYDPKSFLWFGMSLLLNVGAAVTNAFGPTLISNFGFDKYVTALLNMPFGAVQFLVIVVSSWVAQRWRNKGFVLAGFMIPVIIGLALLYANGTGSIGNPSHFSQAQSLAGYYLLGFLFGGNPLIVTWMISNTAGQTKKSAVMSLYNAGSAVGNIVGPLLFDSSDKPYFIPGLRATLGCFCALFGVIAIQIAVLFVLNKRRQAQRVAVGKPKYIYDTSMSSKYQAYGSSGESADADGQGAVENGARVALGQNALLDLTDFKNDEFHYLY